MKIIITTTLWMGFIIILCISIFNVIKTKHKTLLDDYPFCLKNGYIVNISTTQKAQIYGDENDNFCLKNTKQKIIFLKIEQGEWIIDQVEIKSINSKGIIQIIRSNGYIINI